MQARILFAASLLTTALAAGAAQAADDQPFSVYLGAGLVSDSNITVDAQDLTSNRGDVALMLEGGASAKLGNADSMQFNLGYDFSQSLHQDLGSFDLQLHTLSAGVQKTVRGYDLGLDYSFSHIRLGGNALLNLHRLSPSVGKLVSSQVYVVGAYEYQKRNFDSLNMRDSNRHAAMVTGYYLMGRSYIYGKYELARDVATGPEFTYWGNYFTIGFKTPVEVSSRDVTIDGRYQYYDRNYSHITPSIAAERSDKRHDFRLSATVPLVDKFKGKLEYEYINAKSNLPSADYNESIITAMVRWEY